MTQSMTDLAHLNILILSLVYFPSISKGHGNNASEALRGLESVPIQPQIWLVGGWDLTFFEPEFL